MIDVLKDRKVVFFDIGYTLDAPASGDWMFTLKFLERAGSRLAACDDAAIRNAREAGMRYLERDHRVATVEAECRQFARYYAIVSEALGLGLDEAATDEIARDRVLNMANYVPYPGIGEVLGTLSRTHRLGVISDTWPSVDMQLEAMGVARYFSFHTYSCDLGVFKPDRRMYLDALAKAGVPAEAAAFIDDIPRNLAGAAALGIAPILIATNPESDADAPYTKIRDLRELIR